MLETGILDRGDQLFKGWSMGERNGSVLTPRWLKIQKGTGKSEGFLFQSASTRLAMFSAIPRYCVNFQTSLDLITRSRE